MSTNPIPEGYHGATPYLIVKGAAAALDFYARAFGATEKMRLTEPDGRIGHAEFTIGDAGIMIADEYPEFGILGPQSLGGSPVTIHLYVENIDALAASAAAVGATVVRPVADQFYGDRGAKFEDPFGHSWWIASRTEEVSPEEMQRRYDALTAEHGTGGSERQAAVQPIPRGYHTVTPYFVVQGAAEFIEWLTKAFDAKETFRGSGSGGGMHAEMRIGDSMIMLGERGHGAPGYAAQIYLYVADVDAAYERAMAAGATASQEPTDQEYGDRTAFVQDPFGNTWYLATRIRNMA